MNAWYQSAGHLMQEDALRTGEYANVVEDQESSSTRFQNFQTHISMCSGPNIRLDAMGEFSSKTTKFTWHQRLCIKAARFCSACLLLCAWIQLYSCSPFRLVSANSLLWHAVWWIVSVLSESSFLLMAGI